jgi:hypothetical protein
VPYRSPFNGIGYSNETAFFASLSGYCGAYADEDGSGRLFQVRGKIKWSELVDRIFEAAITIETVRSQPAERKNWLNSGNLAGVRLDENCE